MHWAYSSKGNFWMKRCPHPLVDKLLWAVKLPATRNTSFWSPNPQVHQVRVPRSIVNLNHIHNSYQMTPLLSRLQTFTAFIPDSTITTELTCGFFSPKNRYPNALNKNIHCFRSLSDLLSTRNAKVLSRSHRVILHALTWTEEQTINNVSGFMTNNSWYSASSSSWFGIHQLSKSYRLFDLCPSRSQQWMCKIMQTHEVFVFLSEAKLSSPAGRFNVAYSHLRTAEPLLKLRQAIKSGKNTVEPCW